MKKYFLSVFVMTMLVGVNGLPAQEFDNDTIKTIMTRRVVRDFTSTRVSHDQLLTIVKAGMAAPSAMDKRPCEFIVITSKILLKKLGENLPYADIIAKAPAAIIVCGNTQKQFGGKDTSYWVMDASAAIENMLLAAESMDLGAAWSAVYPEAKRIELVCSIIRMPEHVIPLGIVPVGFIEGKPKTKDKYNHKQLHWEQFR